MTKPTAMAQGRVAHLIEWKGWCKPVESPSALESAFSSYCHLSEGEQEARFAAGRHGGHGRGMVLTAAQGRDSGWAVPIRPSVHSSICPFIHLSIHPSTHPSIPWRYGHRSAGAVGFWERLPPCV